MGKRRGIGVEIDINSDTLNNISKLWDSFSNATGLVPNQIEGVMYGILSGKKVKYLITERITYNKNGLALLEANKIIPRIDNIIGVNTGYCIVHIPEKGWTHRKIELSNDDYISGLDERRVKFRTERFNIAEGTISIRETSFNNK